MGISSSVPHHFIYVTAKILSFHLLQGMYDHAYQISDQMYINLVLKLKGSLIHLSQRERERQRARESITLIYSIALKALFPLSTCIASFLFIF